MNHHPGMLYDRVVRTVCSPNCLATCGVNAFVKDDRVVKLEPASFPDPGFERICLRGIAMATERLHHPDRLTHPLLRVGKRGACDWQKITWDEAFARIIAAQTKIAEKHGFRGNAWIKGSGNYGYRAGLAPARAAHSLQGSIFSYFGLGGDFAGMVAYKAALGEFARSNDISEIGGAKYFLSAGKNIADTAHSDMHFLFDAMENGCKFVMLDSRFSRSAAKADEWAAPRPGTDAALALGMIHTVITENLIDEPYITKHTNLPFLVRRDNGLLLRERDVLHGGTDSVLVWDGATQSATRPEHALNPTLRAARTIAGIDCHTGFDASWDVWQQYTPAHADSICEVPAGQIRHIAREYATTDPAWIWLGLGPQRYHHGHLPVRAWITLAALCGNIGKPYAGVGIYDAANVTMLLNQPQDYLKPNGRAAHMLPGTQMLDILISEQPYPVKSLWMVAYGFGTQSPLLRRFAEEALPKLDLFVVSEQLMTSAAELADIVLPCTSYYEEDWDVVGSGESWYVQLRRQAVPPVGESRSDYDVFKELCTRHGLGADWQDSPEEICRKLIVNHADARISGVDWETLKRDGVARVPVERPYTPFRDMKFNTPSGRIELYQEQFFSAGEAVAVHKEQLESRRGEKATEFPLNLMSYKHTHSTHAQHMMLPSIREMIPEPRLEFAPTDAKARGIKDGDTVRVFNARGAFKVKALVSPSLKPGTVAIPQGFWPRDFIEGHPSFLGHVPRNTVQDQIAETNYPIWDILCEAVLERSNENER